MILVWNNARSFQRHIEDMKAFRQAHGPFRNEAIHSRDMPVTHNVNHPRNTGGGRHVIRTGNKTIIVPIWKVNLPANLQN